MTFTVHENLIAKEQRSLDEMRASAYAQGNPNEHLTTAGKVANVQRVLDSNELLSCDTWKASALGVLFGDSLQQAMEIRLQWVIAEDKLTTMLALN